MCCGTPRKVSCLPGCVSIGCFLAPFTYPLEQHQLAQPGDAVLQGKAGPQASSSASASRSTLGCHAGAVGSAMYIAGTFGAILMEQETWEPLLWSAFPAWTAVFSLLCLHLISVQGAPGTPWVSWSNVPPWAWVGFATLSLMQDSSSALSPRPSQDSPFSSSPLFSSAASWLCCIVLGLVLKRGPWTQLPKLSMIREVHLLFRKAVGGVKC